MSESFRTSTADSRCLEIALANSPAPHPVATPPGADPVPVRAEDLCDRHGAALYLLALTITGCPVESQAAVVATFSDACRDGQPARSVDDGEVRRRLAGRVYVECAARDEQVRFDPAVRPLLFEDFIPWLGTLSSYQRAAIGLCVYGEHRVWQAAEVLDVSTATVHELLFWGLQDLAQWSRVPPARPAFAPLGRQSAGD